MVNDLMLKNVGTNLDEVCEDSILDRKWKSPSAYSGMLTIWEDLSLFVDIQMFSSNSSNLLWFHFVRHTEESLPQL
jgi:hypothetical protein